MPPKKKSKASVQTKLNFKPISVSSPAALLTVETAPLQLHKTNVHGVHPPRLQPPRPHSSTISAPYQRNEPSPQPFGGKSRSNETTGIMNSDNIISTKNPAVSSGSVSQSGSVSSSALSTSSFRSAVGMFNKRIDFKEAFLGEYPRN